MRSFDDTDDAWNAWIDALETGEDVSTTQNPSTTQAIWSDDAPDGAIHYAARTHPELYAPMLHSVLVRIAASVGLPGAAVWSALEPLTPHHQGRELGPWRYLMSALDALRPLWTPAQLARLRAALSGGWFLYFLEGHHEVYRAHVLVDDPCALEMDTTLWGEPIFLDCYPEEAWPFLSQETFVGGVGEDVVGLWRQPRGHACVCHAHPEGLWLLGADAIDFAERAAARLGWVQVEHSVRMSA